MAEQRVYPASGLDLRGLADAINTWFKAHDFESRVFNSIGGGQIVQARQPETWRTVLGLSTALNVTLTPRGSELVVDMDAARWEDKLAVGAVGLLIHPLLITAAYGVWKQSKLPEQIFGLIDKYLSARGIQVPAPYAAPYAPDEEPSASGEGTPARAYTGEMICPSCERTSGPEAKFCESCGTQMKPKPRSVPIRID